MIVGRPAGTKKSPEQRPGLYGVNIRNPPVQGQASTLINPTMVPVHHRPVIKTVSHYDPPPVLIIHRPDLQVKGNPRTFMVTNQLHLFYISDLTEFKRLYIVGKIIIGRSGIVFQHIGT